MLGKIVVSPFWSYLSSSGCHLFLCNGNFLALRPFLVCALLIAVSFVFILHSSFSTRIDSVVGS